MEIIFIIGSLITVAILWNLASNFIEKRKENRIKINEYPQVLKELSDEKLLSKKYKDNYENEIVKTNRFLSEISYKNKILQDLTLKVNTKSQELDESIKYLENYQKELNNCEIKKDENELRFKEQIRINNKLNNDFKKIETKYIESNQKSINILRERDELKNTLKKQHDLYLSIENKSDNSVSKITSMYSDFLLLEYDIIARRLENKKRPAISESKRIKELKVQSKFHIQQYRQMLYKYEYLLNVFPELTNYVDDFDTLKRLENVNSIEGFKDDFDNVQNYLTKEEYFDLDENYRNQLALDRYLKGKKTNWQIGRDYEMSCGISYEERGWEVEYFGMEKRLNDLGRDLIARKGNEVEIIQCKLWKKTKTIHEKHILQLYGTTIIDRLINPDLFKVVTPVFITNTSLSETATKFAKIFGSENRKMGDERISKN
ncbi:restriction endonuclease [Tenacibaculum ovolyticum]|uniref:restriction endonuclease n=1 Tax=Tenacibaculum ovolyticum TaxID=104270 RepID=UPI000412AEDC|nr:restriction endonuclease [Tenacibaculum ovolyticum]